MRSESFIRFAWHELRMGQVQKARAGLAQRPFAGGYPADSRSAGNARMTDRSHSGYAQNPDASLVD